MASAGAPRQTLARVLFAGAVGGLAALGLHAAGSGQAVFAPFADEASAVRLAGLALAVGGQVLTVAARSGMGRRWRVGIPDQAPDALVTTGLFGVSRNPVFLGMLAMAAGLALAVPSPAVIACSPRLPNGKLRPCPSRSSLSFGCGRCRRATRSSRTTATSA